ncbi:ribosome biogenesis GTP-binding protein YihA/YsxC [Bacteroidota bacterium]|nr:ribosome biogenesis GTP-binding protein YihA/YsxC [Bacteroidota bacterium]
MDVFKSEFISSSPNVKSCPYEFIPEYPFIGRSNVGKSSLINSICQKKNIAKTSRKPGKTKLINHFKINNSWYLTDLPGYGYANVSKTLKKNIDIIIEDYFLYRKQIRLIFLIIDIRHDPLEIDLTFISWLISQGKRFTLIFSKCDKLKNEEVQAQKYIMKIKKKFNETPKYFITSSKKKVGIKEILTHINDHNNL